MSLTLDPIKRSKFHDLIMNEIRIYIQNWWFVFSINLTLWPWFTLHLILVARDLAQIYNNINLRGVNHLIREVIHFWKFIRLLVIVFKNIPKKVICIVLQLSYCNIVCLITYILKCPRNIFVLHYRVLLTKKKDWLIR